MLYSRSEPLADEPYYDMLYSFIHGKGYKMKSFSTILKSNSEQLSP